MGTTLDALTGDDGVALQWVLAIDGFEYLVTDGDTAAAVTAWAGTPWSSALGGLFIDGQFEQTLDPWMPIKGAGDLTLLVRDCDGNDTLAKRIFKSRGTETQISATVDNNDTTINVQSTSGLTSADVYLGIERIGFSGSTSTTFTGADRGKYCPFNRSGASDHEFGRYHRITDSSLSPNAKPLVSSVPRVWAGKWVGLWLHRKVAGVLDVKAQAQLVFAGRIADIRENESGDVVIQAAHVIESIAEATVLDSQFRVSFQEGVYLTPDEQATDGIPIEIVTYNGTTATTVRVEVVASGATGYQINEGRYTYSQIVQHISKVATAAYVATDINVACDCRLVDSGGPRVEWAATFASGTGSHATLKLNYRIAVLLGMAEADQVQRFESVTSVGTVIETKNKVAFACVRREAETAANIVGAAAPYRVLVFDNPKANTGAGPYNSTLPNYYNLPIKEYDGSFYASYDSYFDQFGLLRLADDTEDTGNRFLLSIGGYTFLATWTTGGGDPVLNVYAAHPTIPATGDRSYLSLGLREGNDGDLFGTQTVVVTGGLTEVVTAILASTSTPAYNHATYDKGIAGVGVPWELLGTTFVDSLQQIDALSGGRATMILDKPTRFTELLSVDMVLRRMHLVWRNGGLRFVQWSQPIDADDLPELTESNKAGQAGDKQVTVSTLTDQWVRNVIKVEYDRELGSENYYRTVTIEDAASVSDIGRQLPITLKARNAFSVGGSGASIQRIERILPEFAAWAPLVTRPLYMLRRTIDFSLFEDFGIGQPVSITDNFVRDPATGERGLSGAIGMVVGHRFNYGGPDPANPMASRPMFGEVDVVIMGTEKIGDYCPAAEVDDTADSGGFTNGWNSGTSTLRTIAQKYQTAGTYDAGYFEANDEIQVIEIDPDPGTTPTPQNATVVSVSTTDIVLDASVTLSAGVRYRVIPRKYADCTSAQRANRAYVCDNADGLVQNAREGLQFAEAINENAQDLATLSTAAVLVHDGYSDEGMPVDIGADHALSETINNLLAYRQLMTQPVLLTTAEVGGASASNVIHLFPFAVPMVRQSPEASEFFRLEFAPTFRSSNGGTATVIVTVSQFPPRSRSDGTSIASQPRWVDKFYQKTWTTTSTTVAEVTQEVIDLADVCSPQYPFAWIAVEIFGTATEYHGLTTLNILPWEP